MATILGNWYSRIKGGWKTVGAGGIAFADSGMDWSPGNVGVSNAMRLSAYFACVRLLSEITGSLTFKMFDDKKQQVFDHDLLYLMQQPNVNQAGDAFVAAMAGNKNVYGNAMAHIRRFGHNGKVYALDFYESELWDVALTAQGVPQFKLNGEAVPSADVLHWAGHSLGGYWGLPTLLAGAEAMSMQIESNRSAARTFANGLRAGGFFTIPENRQAFNDAQLEKFKSELAKYAEPQNTAKWMPLLPGMGIAANTQYRIDPVTAELLQSRYFGIEEICRFMGVPPPLIGHTDKASSWASSLDSLYQLLVTSKLLPDAVRFENQIAMKLLGRNERSRLNPTFDLDALLRGDAKTRWANYKTARSIGAMSANDVRDAENKPAIEGGDDYTPVGAGGGTPGENNNQENGNGS